MRIRTQLIVALLLLSVVPMSLIVAFNYSSSIRALRRAVASESAVLAEDMESRMASVGGEIERRVARLGTPLGRLATIPQAAAERREVMGEVVAGLGDTAPLVESFELMGEWTPAPSPAPPDGPRPAVPPTAPTEVEAGPIKVRMSEVMEVIGVDLTDVSAMMEYVEDGIEGLPPEVDRELVLESARSGLEAVSALARSVRLQVETDDELAVEIEEARRRTEERQRGRLEETWAGSEQPFLRELMVPIREEGREVGAIKANVRGDELLRTVLTRTRRQQGEIPFALDGAGNLYTLRAEEKEMLESIPVAPSADGPEVAASDQWVVVVNEDAESGLAFGIARPIRDSLAEMRRAALRNFSFGVGLIGLALLGILPLSRRMTRDLQVVTDGAGRIAAGDLETRVDVRSRNEIGRLAGAFNQMATDLSENQRRLLAASKARRDQELEQELFRVEFDRKSRELEEARRFQLSLLPKELPRHPDFEVAVLMRTATEVGGDYYDFRLSDDGGLTAVIGDATGHGARAGTMVTVVKSLFSAVPAEEGLADFLAQGAEAVKRMSLGRMAMALALARLEGPRLRLASAGMPPPQLYRSGTGEIEEIQLEGMPLGGLQFTYREVALAVAPGDTLLLMSDGLPELPDEEGDPLGYARVASLYGEVAGSPPQRIVDHLAAAAESWAGPAGPSDDITFVAIRVR